MRKRTSSGCYSGQLDMEIGSNIDLSLLRRPLTPFTGFQEAKNAFDKGTVEVRHLLLYECGLIYECNVCRNMFRSLANFISHKRVFCCTSSREINGTHNATNGSDAIRDTKANLREYALSKDELDSRQKIAQSQETGSNRQMSSSDAETAEKQETCLLAERNNSNHHQDYASLKVTDRKSDVNAKPAEQELIQSKEIPTPAYVFQCPSCSLTFLKSSSVIRHLAIVHNVPIRIRTMRDSTTKTRSDMASKNAELPKAMKTNRKLKSLQMPDCSSSGGEMQKDSDPEMTTVKCIFCQKNFERRAALVTHMQNCRVKTDVVERDSNEQQSAEIPKGKRIKLETDTDTSTPETTFSPNVDCQLVEQKQDNYQESDGQSAFLETDDVKRTFASLESQTFGTGLHTVSLDKLDISAGESSNASINADNKVNGPEDATETHDPEDTGTSATISAATSTTMVNNSALSMSIKKRRMRTTNAQFCRCKICGKQFNALSNLRRHISMFHYRARKFGCALCDYCAFRRYDIINHLNFVHKLDTDSETISKDLVRVNEVSYTKDDMNDDIVLCSSEEPNASETSTEVKPNEENPNSVSVEQTNDIKLEKRRRRNNNAITAVQKNVINVDSKCVALDGNVEVKLTRQKLKRFQSQPSDGSIFLTKGSQKRPRRNRTKPVNKDFVYDLSALLKKEVPQAENVGNECDTYQLRGSKRRNTLNAQIENTPPVPAFDHLKVKQCDAIKGATRRAYLLLVKQGLAASSTLPEIPAERPQIRPRLTSTARSDSQAGPIIETTELEAARFKSLPLCDDSFLEKIAKESVGSFKIKPCLEQQQHQHSALDSLLQKVDSSKQLNGITRNIIGNEADRIKVESTPYIFLEASLLESGSNNNIALSAIPSYLTTPEQSIPKTLSTPIKPQKRLPSLDRLTETINSLENYYNAQVKNESN